MARACPVGPTSSFLVIRQWFFYTAASGIVIWGARWHQTRRQILTSGMPSSKEISTVIEGLSQNWKLWAGGSSWFGNARYPHDHALLPLPYSWRDRSLAPLPRALTLCLTAGYDVGHSIGTHSIRSTFRNSLFSRHFGLAGRSPTLSAIYRFST